MKRHPKIPSMKRTNISGLPSAGTRERQSFGAVFRGASFGLLPSRKAKNLTLQEVKAMYAPPQTLGAPQDARLAMDSALEDSGCYSLLQHTISLGTYGAMPSFMGYGALQNIAQNGLVRACIETVADDMTRNWVKLSIADAEGGKEEESEEQALENFTKAVFGGDEENAQQEGTEEEGSKNDSNGNGVDDRIDAIKNEMERLRLREVFHKAACLTGYYGGCLLYIEPREESDLTQPLMPSSYSMEARSGKSWLNSIKVIDPINIFPGTYNSSNPLRNDFFKPHFWWILGQQVHASRLLRVIANEPPQLLLPAYNFLGIPQAQILWDYISHFQANREACNRMFNKQSSLLFKTDMTNLLAGGVDALENLDARMNLLARYRNNDSVIALDQTNEDIVTISQSLQGVTDVPRQSLEFVAALNRTPVVKLLGISPGGFNATGESDLRNYYDHILSQQEKIIRQPLTDIVNLIQMSLFGELIPGLMINFEPLSDADKQSQATLQKQKVDTLCALIDRDIISNVEARRILVSSEDSDLNGLDPDDAPEPQEEGMGGMGMGMPGMEGMAGGGEGGVEQGGVPFGNGGSEKALSPDMGMDADIPDGEIKTWRSTESGAHFPVKEGQTVGEAAKEFISSKKSKEPLQVKFSDLDMKAASSAVKNFQKHRDEKTLSFAKSNNDVPNFSSQERMALKKLEEIGLAKEDASYVKMLPNSNALFAKYMDLQSGKTDTSEYKKYDGEKLSGPVKENLRKFYGEDMADSFSKFLTEPAAIKENGLDLASPEEIAWLSILANNPVSTEREFDRYFEGLHGYVDTLKKNAAHKNYAERADEIDSENGEKISRHIPFEKIEGSRANDESWGTKPGKHIVFRSGSLRNPDGIFMSDTFEGASEYTSGSAYGGSNRKTVKAYEVDIKKPFVSSDIHETYEKLFGKPLPRNWQDKWSGFDKKISQELRKQGYDAWVMQNALPPSRKELVYLGKPEEMVFLGEDLPLDKKIEALKNR